MKTVEQHRADCLAAFAPLPAREVPLLEALDCVLAEDVVSPLALPPFDNSSMDGYAVRVADVASSSAEVPSELPVDDDVPAGDTRRLQLVPGSAIRIMTGAPLPAGTEAVVPVEWTDAGTERVRITRAPSSGQHLRPAGDDVTLGETVLKAGTRLTPRSIGLLAAVGRGAVRVHPRPRVVVLSTGSELVGPGVTPEYGQIHDSNGVALVAAALDAGAIARQGRSVADDEDSFTAALSEALDGADLVITSGGVSAGAYDTVKEVLGRLGTVRFEKVGMQPGMPQGFGTVGPAATPIFTLPGNPVSSTVSFEVFVRPAIRRMRGESAVVRPAVEAVAGEGWRSPPAKTQFTRGVLSAGPDGVPVVHPVGGAGSHLVANLATADCLVVVPEGVAEVAVGATVSCMVLDARSPFFRESP